MAHDDPFPSRLLTRNGKMSIGASDSFSPHDLPRVGSRLILQDLDWFSDFNSQQSDECTSGHQADMPKKWGWKQLLIVVLVLKSRRLPRNFPRTNNRARFSGIRRRNGVAPCSLLKQSTYLASWVVWNGCLSREIRLAMTILSQETAKSDQGPCLFERFTRP